MHSFLFNHYSWPLSLSITIETLFSSHEPIACVCAVDCGLKLCSGHTFLFTATMRAAPIIVKKEPGSKALPVAHVKVKKEPRSKALPVAHIKVKKEPASKSLPIPARRLKQKTTVKVPKVTNRGKKYKRRVEREIELLQEPGNYLSIPARAFNRVITSALPENVGMEAEARQLLQSVAEVPSSVLVRQVGMKHYTSQQKLS